MDMTEEEKKLQEETVEAEKDALDGVLSKGNEYKNPYEDQIKGLYDQIANRPQFDFKYDPSEDELYQNYVDRYMSLGKQAMRDTIGQAAALTGGYGSSYGQRVGQQTYDTYVQGANDKLAEFANRGYELAYKRYNDEGDRLTTQYALTQDLADEDYRKYQDRLAQQQADYDRLATIISASGYTPTADELARANMSGTAAKALKQQWAATYPQLAYNQGVITAEEYLALTGSYPVGYVDPNKAAYSGWDGGHWGPNSTKTTATWNGIAKEVAGSGLEATIKNIQANADMLTNPEQAIEMAYGAVWSERPDR